MMNMDKISITYKTNSDIQKLIRAALLEKRGLQGVNVSFAEGQYTLNVYQSANGPGIKTSEEAESARDKILDFVPELKTAREVHTQILKGGRLTTYYSATLTMPPEQFRQLATKLGVIAEYEKIAEDEKLKLAEAQNGIDAVRGLLGNILPADSKIINVELSQKPDLLHSANIEFDPPIRLTSYDRKSLRQNYTAMIEEEKAITDRVSVAFGLQPDGTKNSKVSVNPFEGSIKRISIDGEKNVAGFVRKVEEVLATQPSHTPRLEHIEPVQAPEKILGKP